jgi:hypothetical protein
MKMKRELKGITAISVASVRSVGMISEEDYLQWSELEVTVHYHVGEKTEDTERLPLLAFKQLIKEADREGIEVKYLKKREEGPSSVPEIDVIAMARELLKKEGEFDPAIL